MINGTLFIGDVQAFIQYVQQFKQTIAQTVNLASFIQSTIALTERIFELLDFPEEVPEAVEVAAIDLARGEVIFDRFSFRYTPDRFSGESRFISLFRHKVLNFLQKKGGSKVIFHGIRLN